MKYRTTWSVVSVAAFGLFFYGTGESNPPANPGSPSAPTGAQPTGAPSAAPPAEAQLPWLATVRQNCDAYRGAPNQIQKSRIFRDTEALVRHAVINGVRGTLRSMETNQGGSEVGLTVVVGQTEFATESLMSPIREGSAVYQQASTLREGQCVVFSGTIQGESSLVEESKVCDPEYFFRFTSIAPCQ